MHKLTAGFLGRAILACAFCCAAGAQTDGQRAIQDRLAKHAKLFRRYELKRRVEDMKPNTNGTIDLTPMTINNYVVTEPPPTLAEELQTLALVCDAIVQGTTEASYSALTPGHSYIYSDWIVKITRVLKGTSLVPLKVGDRITVARPGGELQFNNYHVVARDVTFPDFTVGKEYILYLVADAETASFIATAQGSVDISGPTPVFLLDPKDQVTNLRSFSSRPTADFLTEVERNIYQ